jgi:hypothetical protein
LPILGNFEKLLLNILVFCKLCYRFDSIHRRKKMS